MCQVSEKRFKVLCGVVWRRHHVCPVAFVGGVTHPDSISNIRMPSAHQSTALPWPLLWMTSGARYSGVPQRVHVLWGMTEAESMKFGRCHNIWLMKIKLQVWSPCRKLTCGHINWIFLTERNQDAPKSKPFWTHTDVTSLRFHDMKVFEVQAIFTVGRPIFYTGRCCVNCQLT